MKKLNNLTNLFLDYAESMAEDEQVMKMKDWINEAEQIKNDCLMAKNVIYYSGRGKIEAYLVLYRLI